MNPAPQAQSAPDAGLAGSMLNFVQQLQKNRFGGVRQLQGAPIGGETQADPKNFEALLNEAAPNEQEKDAAGAPGALQKERGEEQRRERDVRPREEESGLGKSAQIQRAEEEQRRQKMR